MSFVTIIYSPGVVILPCQKRLLCVCTRKRSKLHHINLPVRWVYGRDDARYWAALPHAVGKKSPLDRIESSKDCGMQFPVHRLFFRSLVNGSHLSTFPTRMDRSEVDQRRSCLRFGLQRGVPSPTVSVSRWVIDESTRSSSQSQETKQWILDRRIENRRKREEGPLVTVEDPLALRRLWSISDLIISYLSIISDSHIMINPWSSYNPSWYN